MTVTVMSNGSESLKRVGTCGFESHQSFFPSGNIVVDVIAEVCAGREFDSRRLQKYTTVCGRKTDFVGVSDVATHAAEFYGVLLKGA